MNNLFHRFLYLLHGLLPAKLFIVLLKQKRREKSVSFFLLSISCVRVSVLLYGMLCMSCCTGVILWYSIDNKNCVVVYWNNNVHFRVCFVVIMLSISIPLSKLFAVNHAITFSFLLFTICFLNWLKSIWTMHHIKQKITSFDNQNRPMAGPFFSLAILLTWGVDYCIHFLLIFCSHFRIQAVLSHCVLS